MRGIRVGRLMLWIIIIALGTALIIQERRASEMRNILRMAGQADQLERVGRSAEARPLWSRVGRSAVIWAGE